MTPQIRDTLTDADTVMMVLLSHLPSLWAAPPSVNVFMKMPSFSRPASAPTPIPMILRPRPSLPTHNINITFRTWSPTQWHIQYHIMSYHTVELKRQNCLQVGTDKPKLQAKMQSVSNDDERKSHVLSWQRKVYSDWEDVTSSGRARSRSLGQQWESTATDGWSLDRWHQKTIGACRTKWPSAGKTGYWHERSKLRRCTSVKNSECQLLGTFEYY